MGQNYRINWKVSKDTIILYSFFFSGVTFGIAGSDSLPWHILTILFLGRLRFKAFDIFLILAVFFILFATALQDSDKFSISLFQRQFLNYFSLMIGGVYLLVRPPNIEKLTKIIFFVLILNILIGILQYYSDAFAIFSNARMGEIGVRGSVGLFAEPTSFGLFSVFCFLYSVSLLNLPVDKQVKLTAKRIILLSTLSIILINKSTAAIMILFFFCILYGFKSFKGLFAIVIFAICLYALFLLNPDTRFSALLRLLISNDLIYLLSVDGSINERLSSIVGPYYGILQSYFIPNSAFSYHETYLNMRVYTDGFFWFGGSDKIMNYLGTIIYELSFLGFVLIYRYIFRNFRTKVDMVYLIVVLFYLSNSVPLLHGYPLLLIPIFNRFSKDTKSEGVQAKNEKLRLAHDSREQSRKLV